MGIRARLLLLVLFAALPVVALDVWSEIARRRGAHEAAGRQVLQLAELAAGEQDRVFGTGRALLAAFAHVAPVREEDGDACSALLTDVLVDFPLYTGLAAVRPDGEIYCSTNPGSRGANLSDRDYFRAALSKGGFAVGASLLGVVSGTEILPMAYAVQGPTGSTERVLVLSLSLTRFSRSLTVPPLPEGSTILVVDSRGTLLARHPHVPERIGRPAGPDELVDAMLARRYGAIEASDFDGTRRRYGVAPLAGSPHILLAVGVPAATFSAAADALFHRELSLVLVAFAAAALVALLAGDIGIRRPLAALERALDRLSTADYTARSGLRSSVPEFARLGERFDEMAGSLERHERELRHALADREMLLREVNHRVKNSLQVISSLLKLQEMTISDTGARGLINDAGRRVIAVAHVHERLYRTERFDRIDVAGYLRALCDDLAGAMAGEGRGPDLVVRAEPGEMAVDRAVPLALIVNELVTNAVKYAYPAAAPGPIEVTFGTTAEGSLELAVTDRGVGLPEDFDLQRATGFGMRIVVALARQLRARVVVERLQPGSRFTVILPAPAGDRPEEPAAGAATAVA